MPKSKTPTGPAGTSNVGDMFDLLDTPPDIVDDAPVSNKPLLHISPVVKSKMGKTALVLQPGQVIPAWDCLAWMSIADISIQVMAAISVNDYLVSKQGQRSFSMEELQAASMTPSAARNINFQHDLEASVLGGGCGGIYTLRLPPKPIGLICAREGLTQWGEPQYERTDLNPLDAYMRLRDSDDHERRWAAEHPRFYVHTAKDVAGVELFDLASKKPAQFQELMLPLSFIHAYYLFREGVDSEAMLLAASVSALKCNRIYFGWPGDCDKTQVTEDEYWAGAGEPTRQYTFSYPTEGPPMAAVFPRFQQQVAAAKARDWNGKTATVLKHRAVNRGAPTGMHDLHGLRT